MEQTIAVVGAGISGLSFAHFCALGGAGVQVFEKELMGGAISSFRLDNDHFAEFGAHTLTNKYRTTLEILRYYGAETEMVPAVPLKFTCYKGNGFQPVWKDIRWMELLSSLPRALGSAKQGSVEEYYSGILGERNYRALFHYAFQAVLCQDPDRFPAALLFKKRYPDKRYPAKFSLRGGMSQLLNLILAHPSISCQYQVVTAISREAEDYVLWSKGARVAKVRNICLASPAHISAGLVEGIEPKLARLLAAIGSTRVDSLLISDIPEGVAIRQNKSIIGIDQPFYSAIRYQAAGRKCWMFHFPANSGTIAQKLQTIAAMFDVSVQDLRVLAARSSLLPSLSVDQLGLLNEIDLQLAGKRIFIASNYMEGLSVEDCCLRAKTEAERCLAMN